MRLICLAGLAGSGKTTVKDILSSFPDVEVFYTRDLAGDIPKENKWTSNALQKDMLQHGKQFEDENGFLRNCFDIIQKKISANTGTIVFDSIRSPKELEFIENFYSFDPVDLLYIECDEVIRYDRIKARDHAATDELIKLRDDYDLGIKNGSPHDVLSLMKLSSYKVDTSGDIAMVRKQLQEVYKNG